ncbi:MAG: hypothetical protein NT069_33295 [Planctomycetota bacterium]|nr:hypothetical protein [Planctomycetota bacterium]
MIPEFVKSIAKTLVKRLVAGQYEEIVRVTNGRRLSVEMIALAIREYGRELIEIPDPDFDSLDVVRVRNSDHPTWTVRVRLWTRDEGASDLCLEFTIADLPESRRIEVDDIHVL